MMVIHLSANPGKTARKTTDTIGVHASFSFFEKLYKYHLQGVLDAKGGDVQVGYHRQCALRCYLVLGWHIHFYGQKCNLCRCGLP